MKILVAEDDLVNRMALCLVLRRAGHEVLTAQDGLEAWHLLQQPEAPQIAVLDWMMPGLDGLEICRRIRAQTPRRATYLLLLTARAEKQDVIQGLQAGANDFLHKPFDPSELKARLEVGLRTVNLYNDQLLNLDQARRLLTIANAGLPQWIGLNDDLTLHLSHHSASTQSVGGDHCWARTFPSRAQRGPVTVIGLRDQSGHEVNCILRSIATDLFHKEAMDHGLPLEEQIGYLNDRLCSSGMFAGDDFLTGLTLELDHASLRLRYVSCGHPPIFLVRQNGVIVLAGENDRGRNLPLGSLAGMAFEAGEQQLQSGDRLVLFTDGLLELGKRLRGAVMTIGEIRRSLEELVKQSPGCPVQTLVRKLMEAANGQAYDPAEGPPSDDMSILGLELEPDAGPQELVFYPAGLDDLDQAIQETCVRLMFDWKIEPDSAQRLRLFLDEALTNAWLHGNRQNPALPIRLRWGRHNGRAIVVEDAGSGFDPLGLADPRSPAGLLQETGRGVHLIRNSCEWVEWKKGGARLAARLSCPGS